MKKQSGSAHTIVIIILILALLGALGFIFWQNFINKTEVKTESKNTVKEITPSEQTKISVPDGWVKYTSNDLSFYYPGDWKLEDDSNFEMPMAAKSATIFLNSESVQMGSFLVMRDTKGYDSVLQGARNDNSIGDISESTAGGFKVISYTAYGTADKNPENRSKLHIIFDGDNEYRITTNPSIVDDDTFGNLLKTLQRN